VTAFVVPRPGVRLDAAQLHRHCTARLAPFKVPKSFELVTALPRTASGKVRRIDLR
jgi:acyl-coenzyme A synthetase/AMP-(fatty) acid ligase